MLLNQVTRRGRLAIVLAMVAASAAPALAHLGSKKIVRVTHRDVGPELHVEIEAVDAAMELGLGEAFEWRALEARSPQVRRWLAQGLSVSAGGEPCVPEAGDPEPFEREAVRYLRVRIAYRCEGTGELVFHDDTIFDADRRHEAVVLTAYGGEAHILRKGRQEVALGEPQSPGSLLGVFLWEGVLHFATGYDHVLFLLSLVLAAGFVSRRESTGKALKHVAWLVTAFTLGHSITLVSAALEVVVLPVKPVEVIIAASIVAVAGWNIVKPEVRAPMPGMAFAFGLVHGFGFSAVLAEVGLPAGHRVLALVAFNVGIELAQLAFVALVLGPIAWAARFERYPRIVRVLSAATGALAIGWVIERI